MPLPCSLVVKNGSKSRARVCSSMPVPVSLTLRRAYDPARALRVGGGVRFVELDLVDLDGQPPAVGHRVARVDDQVQHDLLDLRLDRR